MLKYNIKSIAILLLVSIVTMGMAQTSSEVFQGIQQFYNGNELQSYVVNTQLYNNDGRVEDAYSRRIEIKKKGNNLYYKTGADLFILNEDYMLNINSDQSLIICNKINPNSKSLDNLMALDKVLSSYDSIYYQGITNGQRHYIMNKENSVHSVIEIFLELNSYKVTKMIYRYNERLEGDFAYMEIKVGYPKLGYSKNEDQFFSIKPYLQIDQNMVFAAKKYKKYDLVVGEGLEYGLR